MKVKWIEVLDILCRNENLCKEDKDDPFQGERSD